MMRKAPFLLPLLSTLALDQASKALIMGFLAEGESLELLDGFFRLTLLLNPGALFGVGKGWGWLFLAFSVAFLLLLPFLLRGRYRSIEGMGFGFLAGGALGNVVDRVRLGAVVDFLDLGYKGWRWPVFNLADVAITVGFGLLVLKWLRD